MQTPTKIVYYGLLAAIVVAVVFFAMNRPGGPTDDVVGIVQSAGGLPNDTGPSARFATVRIADGTIINAVILPNVTVRPGETARVRVYRRVVTGWPHYEIVGTTGSK